MLNIVYDRNTLCTAKLTTQILPYSDMRAHTYYQKFKDWYDMALLSRLCKANGVTPPSQILSTSL